MKYAGAGWVRKSLGVEPSAFGSEVADILGIVWRGIYHLRDASLQRVDWRAVDMLDLTVPRDLATYDFAELTDLVVLCHDRAIRLSIEPAMSRLRLRFSRRSRDGAQHERHPTIEQAIERVRRFAAPELPEVRA